MAFYEGLRDSTAFGLITKFGMDGTLNKSAGGYDPATGVDQETLTPYPLKFVKIPKGVASSGVGTSRATQYADDTLAKSDQEILMSATELFAAGVEPAINDLFNIGGKRYRIVWALPVDPGGIAVIYKAGLVNA